MIIALFILLGIVIGALGMYGIMHVNQTLTGFERRVSDLEGQVKGKQLPYTVRYFLEDMAALGDMQDDDLAVLVVQHQRMGNLLESVLERKQKDMQLIRKMRQGEYNPDEAMKSRK